MRKNHSKIVCIKLVHLPYLRQAKVLTGGGDLRFAQVDVPLSVSHSRF